MIQKDEWDQYDCCYAKEIFKLPIVCGGVRWKAFFFTQSLHLTFSFIIMSHGCFLGGCGKK